MKYKLLFLFLIVATVIYAQNQPTVYSFENFIKQVAIQHPTAQQIQLLAARAKLELQRARGGTDPILESQYDRKLFNESNYYNLAKINILIPTYYGVSFEAGFLSNSGDYVNPEDKTPYNGQAYAGVNVNLLQGLLTNERKVALEQSKLLIEINTNQAQNLINNLLYDAAYVYWEWSFAYNEVKIWEQAYNLATFRLAATRESFIFGDKPALDTLETYSNLLDRQLRMQEARLDFSQATIMLNNYLWQNNNPSELPPLAIPTAIEENIIIDSVFYNRILSNLATQHPEMRLYNLQLSSLNIDQQLKNNKLLPKLDLKYNFLAYGGTNFFPNSGLDFANNYKLGLKFSYPLLTRQSRADVNLNQIKTTEVKFKQAQKQLELSNKLKNYYVEMQNYQQQINILKQNVRNYETLLAAEYEKFRLGESSIFVLNSREIKLIETQQKLLATLTKFQKAKSSLSWVAAQLANF